MKTTAENWRFIAENTRAILPFEHYMIHTAIMCNLAFSEEEITEDRTTAHLVKVAAVMKTLEQHAKSTSLPKKATSPFHRADSLRQASFGFHFILGQSRLASASRSCQTLGVLEQHAARIQVSLDASAS